MSTTTDQPKTFIIHLRARRPIKRDASSIIDVVKWVLGQVSQDDLYEIHDVKDRLLWGRSTGLNKKVFDEL